MGNQWGRAAGGASGADKLLQIGAPAGGEGGVPAGSIWIGRRTDAEGPAEMVGGRNARGEGGLLGFSGEPLGKLGVVGDAVLKAFGEAGEACLGISGSAGREGALVIHLPKQQQGHAGLAVVRLGGGEMGVMTNPVRQTGIYRAEIHHEGGAGDGSFCGLHPGTPCGDVHPATRATIPADEGVVGGGAEGWVEGFLTGEVSQDTGEGLEAAGQGSITALREGLASAVLKQLQEDEGDGARDGGARVGILHDEGKKTRTQPVPAGGAS